MLLFDSIGYEIFIALVTGAIIATGNHVKNFVQNKRIERKYPVSGKYLSVFENEDKESNSINSYAPITIKQKGKRIFGVSCLDDREWILEGHVSDLGWVYGTYYSKKINDTGIGNFFLSLNPDKSLEGIWSGYGSVGKKILSGRYVLNIIEQDLITKRVDKNNYLMLFQLLSLYGISLNKTITSRLVDNEDNCINGIIVYNKENNAIACAIYGMIDSHDMINIGLMSNQEDLDLFEHSNRIAIITHLVVNEKYRLKGIGTQTMEIIIRQMKKENINIVFALNNKANPTKSHFLENNLFNIFSDRIITTPEKEEVILYIKKI